jgi:uncharacterized protein YukE
MAGEGGRGLLQHGTSNAQWWSGLLSSHYPTWRQRWHSAVRKTIEVLGAAVVLAALV